MSRFLGINRATAVELPCGAPAIDDVLTVDPTNPKVGVWKKAGATNIQDAAIVRSKMALGAVGPAQVDVGTENVGSLNVNSDFNIQSSSGVMADGWGIVTGTMGTTIDISSAGRTGARALKFFAVSAPFVGNYGARSQSVFPVEAGETYGLRATLQSVTSGNIFPVNIVVEWYQADGVTASAVAATTTWTPKSTTAGVYIARESTAVAPSDARYARLRVSQNVYSTNVIYVDRASISRPTSSIQSSASTGASFPTEPYTNQRYFRTDRGVEYYWDGTRWLSVNEYHAPMPAYDALPSNVTVSGSIPLLVGSPGSASGQIFLARFVIDNRVISGNSGSAYWTFQPKTIAGTALGTASNTSAEGTGDTGWRTRTITIDSVRTLSSDTYGWFINVTKTASPGPLQVAAHIIYRLVG